MLPYHVLPAAELQPLLEKRVEWHNANISKFVETGQNYVDPSQEPMEVLFLEPFAWAWTPHFPNRQHGE